jgi:hypothetical protein
LNVVDLSIQDERLSVEIRGQRLELDNSTTIRTDSKGKRTIVAVGDRVYGAATNTTDTVVRSFDKQAFDPDLASSMVRYLLYRGADEFGLTLLKYGLGLTLIRMDWPAWPTLPSEQRRRFLDLLSAIRARVEINGDVAIRTTAVRRILGRPPIVTDPAST